MLKIGALLFVGLICTACIRATPENNSRLRYELQAHTAKFIDKNIAPEQIKIFKYRKDVYDHFWQAIALNTEYSCSENWRNCGNLYCVQKASSTVSSSSKSISNEVPALKQSQDTIHAKPADNNKELIGTLPATTAVSTSMVVIENKGKLRKTPAKNAGILKTLKKNDLVKVIKQKDEWFMVELDSGEVGWCHKSILAQVN